MSIYYFIKQRFPRKNQRSELRLIFDQNDGKIPDSIIHDDNYFENFRLKLAESLPNHPNRFKGVNGGAKAGQRREDAPAGKGTRSGPFACRRRKFLRDYWVVISPVSGSITSTVA